MSKGPSVFDTNNPNNGKVPNTIAHYNNSINKELHEHICGKCLVKDETNRHFYCHLPDLSSHLDLDILIVFSSYINGDYWFVAEDNQGDIDIGLLTTVIEEINNTCKHIENLYAKTLKPKVNFLTAIKCPLVNWLDEIGVKQLNLCSTYIQAEIEHINPKLVLVIDPLAFKAVTKLGNAPTYQGKIVQKYNSQIGYVNFVSDPTSQGVEERRVYLNSLITEALVKPQQSLEKIAEALDQDLILAPEVTTANIEAVVKALDRMLKPGRLTRIGVDIETTGLDFKTDEILSISFVDKNIVLAFIWELVLASPVIQNRLYSLLESENVTKIFQNALFDLKFLEREGYKVNEITDTKYMSHLENENEPSSLLFITKKHYPGYLC